jgi:hypothetical protein
MAMHQIEGLRAQIASAMKHGTALIADLQAITDRFAVVLPSLGEQTERGRWKTVARLCAIEEKTPEQLEALVENLADVLAGLTTSDGGQAWVQHRQQTLDAGDEDVPSAA